MEMDCIEKRIRGEFPTGRASIPFYIMLLILATITWTSIADAYVLRGTVTNNSGKTGRVYLAIDHYADNGTSIDSSGDFTISGVPSGTYTITAVMDTRGDGKLFASDPKGSSASFTVASADKSGIAITISNPATPTPPTPSWLQVYPGDGGAAVRWDIKTEGTADLLPIADHYNFYWSTSPNVSPANTSGGGSKMGVPDPGWGGFYLPGLTNGATLYFVVTAVVKGVEGPPSPVTGPVTIGLPNSGGVTVQGDASLTDFSPTGPLCISLWGLDNGRFFMKCFASPTPSQPFRFDNVPDGGYLVTALVDMNNNGVEDIGDIAAGFFEGTTPPVLVQGAPVSGVAIALPAKNSDVGVFTEFRYPNSYNLFFMAKNNRKVLTNMTATSGPNLAQPIDIRRDSGGWFYYSSLALPGRPNIGDSYVLNLRHAPDNTPEVTSVAITGILDGYATPVSPSGSTSTLAPLMTWSAPSPPPVLSPFRYEVRVYTAAGSEVWKHNKISSSHTYAVYNEDGTATPLVGGTQYYWQVDVKDQHGNHSHGPKVFFTPTATPAKQLTVVSRNPTSAVSIVVAPIDKNSLGSGSSPFTRFYDTGTTVTLTAPATVGGNSFNNWSGCDSVSGTLCTATLSSDKSVSAIYSFLPPPPAGIISASGSEQATLNWNSVPGATSYNLYYSTTPGVTRASGTKKGSVTSPCTVTSLTNGTPYYFVVTAVNTNGEGAESAEVGAVPGMPNAYTLAEFAGMWEGNSVESPGPWWVRTKSNITSNGSFTSTRSASDGPMSPISGNFSITSDGIITIPTIPAIRCTMDAGRTVAACTVTNSNSNELPILTKKAASYSQSDLTGKWEINQIGTPGAHWLQGTGMVNPDGSSSMTYNSDNKEFGTLPGTVTITPDGRVSAQLVTTNPDTSYPDCSMDAGKTVIVCVSTSVEHNESLLTIYTKKATKYSQSDLTGTWAINSLASPDSQWTRGTASVAADGSSTVFQEHSGSTVPEIKSGTLILNTDGNTSVPGQTSSKCSMDAGKTVVVCTGDWTATPRTSTISVWTKTGSVPQDITGRWETTVGNGVIGALLTQIGNSVTGTIRGSSITVGSFSNGIFSGVFPGIPNWSAGPYNLQFVLSADGQTLDGTFSVPGYGSEPVTFKRISNSPQNPDLSPPVIIASYPSPNQSNVQRQNLVVSTTWSKPVNGWDMNLTGKIGGVDTTITDLYDSSKFSYDHTTNTFNMPLRADIILDPMTTYTIRMDGGNDIDWYDPYGIPAWTNTGNAYSFTFTTGNTLYPTKTLGITLSGSGSGSVNSNPSGPIACSWPPQAGTCSTSQPADTALTLIASPGSDSSFGNWGDACSSCDKLLSCQLTFDSDKTCTAVFNVLPLVRIAGPAFYGSIVKAYGHLSNGPPAIIQAQAVELAENVDLDKSIPLTLLGGYDSVFNTISGFTILHGVLNISKGSLIVDRLIVK